MPEIDSRSKSTTLWVTRRALALLAVLAGLEFASLDRGSYQSPSAVGGFGADVALWPFFVSLREVRTHDQTLRHFCGGTLIDPWHVLTAAHCVTAFTPRDGRYVNRDGGIIEVVPLPNSIDRVDYSTVRQVGRIVVHPAYEAGEQPANDIAIIELTRPIENATPARLPVVGEIMPERALTGGFGRTSEGGLVEARQLSSDYRTFAGSRTLLEVPVDRSALCRSAYSRFHASSQLCYGSASGGRDACTGDSGGPLLRRDADGLSTVLGIVSFGHGCGRADSPGVYTNVVAHLGWISRARRGPDWSYVGLWAISRTMCDQPGWHFRERSLATRGGLVCDFIDVREVPRGYDIDATCVYDSGSSWPSRLRLRESRRLMIVYFDEEASSRWLERCSHEDR